MVRDQGLGAVLAGIFGARFLDCHKLLGTTKAHLNARSVLLLRGYLGRPSPKKAK